jgi:hypothetical protein
MRAAGRLAKLEAALPPQAAVLHWLAEAQEHGSLDAYLRWPVGQPPSRAPGVVILERAQARARAAHAGEPRHVIREAERRSMADAVFLFMLVLELEFDAAEMVHCGRLRLAALGWELRARMAEGTSDRQGWATWRQTMQELAVDLSRADAVRRQLEGRCLDGREALFPDTFARCQELRAGVAALAASEPARRGGRGRRWPDEGRRTKLAVDRDGRGLVERVRARTLAVMRDGVSASAGNAFVVRGER